MKFMLKLLITYVIHMVPQNYNGIEKFLSPSNNEATVV